MVPFFILWSFLEQVNLVDYSEATLWEELDSFYIIESKIVHYYYGRQCLQCFVTLMENI